MVAFTNPQKRALRKLQFRLPAVRDTPGEPEVFILKYIAFEAQARKVWHYYRCRSKAKPASKAGIPMAELEKALSHFGVAYESACIAALLDSKLDKRGKKSARNLRNGMAHQWLEEDCKEAASRYDEFQSIFEEFSASLKGAL